MGPPGYAYFYGQIPNQILAAAYGAGAATGLYPGTMAVPPATGGNNSSFKQNAYSTQSYGSGYDTGLGQGNKDFGASSYTAGNTGTGKSSGATGSSGAGGAGHQYCGNTNLGNTHNPLW